MVDLGNLSVGIEVPGMAQLDALDARLNSLNRPVRASVEVLNTPEALAHLQAFREQMNATQLQAGALAETVKGINSSATITLKTAGAADAIAQLDAVSAASHAIGAEGGKVALNVSVLGGQQTTEELVALAATARETASNGKVVITLSAVGAEQVTAQVAAIEAAAKDLQGQNIVFRIDTTGAAEAKAAQQEAAAAAKEAAAAEVEAQKSIDQARREAIILINDYKKTQAELAAASIRDAKETAAAVAQAQAEQDAALKKTQAEQDANLQQLKSAGPRSIMGIPAAAAAPAGLAAGIGISIKDLSDLNTQMSQLQANTTLTDKDMVSLTDDIKKIAVGSSAPIDQIAAAFRHVTNEGFSTADAVKIVTEANMSAVSTGAKLGDVGNALAIVLHDFGMGAAQAGEAMNVLHLAAAQGNVTLEEFSTASAKVWADAGRLGVSLTDAAGAMSALTRAGYSAPQAATLLDGLMTKIINTTPAARKEIEALSQATGVDLVTDFTQAGLAAKGLPAVLDDIQRATHNNADEVFKLLPAMRGGRGEMALTSAEGINFRDVLTSLNETMAGKTNPTLDAYTRAQGLLSTQMGEFRNQFKLTAASIGEEFLPPLVKMLTFINDLPDGVKKVGLEIGLAALAIKTAATAADLLTSGAARLGAALGGDAAAVAVETTVLDANTASLTANAAARGGASLAALRTPAAVGEQIAPTVLAGSMAAKQQIAMDAEVAIRDLSTTTAEATIASRVAGLGKTLGQLVVPVAISLIAYEIIGKPLENAIKEKVNELERPQANIGTLNTDDEATFEAGIRARLDQQQKIVDEYNKYKDSAGYKVNKIIDLGGEMQSDADYKHALEQIALLKKAEEDFQATHHNTQQMGPPLPPGFTDELNTATAAADDLVLHYAQIADKRAELQKAGIPDRLINLSLNPEDFGASKAQQAEATKAISDLQKDNAAMETARKQAAQDYYTDQKQHVQDLATSQKQAVQDAATSQKQSIQDVATAQEQAATKSANAWKFASQQIGQLNFAKGGIEDLQKMASGLDAARDNLAALGETNPHLDNLTSIADGFKAISDAEKDASSAYDGYMLTFNQTDKSIKQLEALKKATDEGIATARAAQQAGTANPAQDFLVAHQQEIDANLTAMIAKLTGNQAGDLVAALKVVPDFSQYDANVRDKVKAEGGGEALTAKVTIETTEAQAALTRLEQQDLDAVQSIKDNAKDAIQQIDAQTKLTIASIDTVAKDATRQIDDLMKPRDLTLTVHANGAITPGGFSPYDEPKAQSAPPGGAFSYADYAKVVGDSPISGQANYDTLLQVANQMGVDARDLLAVMKTESDFGRTAGLIGQQYNYGGMGVNDRGYGHDSGVHATDGGPEYAGYNDLKSFLLDLAGWIKQNGNSFSNYQTADGGQAKNDVMAQLREALPAVAQIVTQSLAGQGQQGGGPNGNGTLNPTGSGGDIGDAGQFNAIRQRIIQKAMQDLNTDTLAGYCEQWVEQTVQAITGKRGVGTDPSTGNNPADALAGFRVGQEKDLQVTQAQAKPGDLVYYGGGTSGHVAIYMGDGQQISTADGPGGKSVIHVEAIGPGAQFINSLQGADQNLKSPTVTMPVNVTGANGQPITPAAALPAQTGAPVGHVDTTVPSPDAQKIIDAQTKANQELAASQELVASKQATFNDTVKNLNPKMVQEVVKEYQTLEPLVAKAAIAALPGHIDAATGKATGPTAEEKQVATNNAIAQTLDLTTLWAQGMEGIKNHSGNLLDIEQQINRVVGGPIAASLNAQLNVTDQIQTANDAIAKTKADQLALETAHTALLAQRQQADAADARAQVLAARQQQDAASARQREQTLEQRALQEIRTAESQRYQDATTAISREHAAIQQMWSDAAQAISRAHATEQQAFSDNEQAISREHAALQQVWADEAQAVSRAHAIETQAFADNEQAIQRQQAAQQMAWRNEDQATQWQATLDQRAARDAAQAIADQHAALQQVWADQAIADAAAKAARDQAWLDQQRAQQDAVFHLQQQQTAEDRAMQLRIDNLTHYGTQQAQALQAQLVAAQTQAGAVTAKNTGQEELLSAQVQGAPTNAAAQNYAEQLAALKDQDALAKKVLADQTTAIQKAIDAEAKLAAEQLWALQQEQKQLQQNHQDAMTALQQQGIMADRAHQDQEAAIAAEITARNLQHTQLMQQWAAEALAVQRAQQAQADAAQNQQHQIMLTRQAITDQWAADTQSRQDRQQALTREWAVEAQHTQDTQQAIIRGWATDTQHRQDAQQVLTRQWADEAQHTQETQQATTRQWAADALARDTQHTTATRLQAAEDLARNNAFADQTWQIGQSQLAEQRRHEDARYQIGLTRTAEDERYKQAKTDLATQLTEEQTQLTALNAGLTAAQSMSTLMDGIITKAGLAANALNGAATAQATYNTQVAGMSTPTGVPYNQFPAPRQFAAGGSVSGWGVVGDSPSGDMSTAEAVYGTYTVIPHDQSAALGLLGGQRSGGTSLVNTAPYAAGTPQPQQVTVNKGGDTFHFTINAAPGQDAKAIAAQIKAMLDAHDRETSATAYGAASGGARS